MTRNLNFLQSPIRNFYLGRFYSLTMSVANQFMDSIFEHISFQPLSTKTFSPASNLVDHFSGADGTIRDLWVISPLKLRILWQSWYWMRWVQVGAVHQLTWICFQRVFQKEIFHQFRFAFCILVVSLLDAPPSLDPCAWPELSRLLVSTFQTCFLPLHFLFICNLKLSSNQSMCRSIVSYFCAVKLRVAIAQDS